MNPSRMPVLYLPHGGGPLPLLGDPAHQELIAFLQTLPARFERPKAVLIVSAHWEQRVPTLTSGERPPLLYDYGGFPPESYKIQYPAPGYPDLANEVLQLLSDCDINAQLDPQRGFDHGMFVPLKLMYPDADIPCVQLSLVEGLDPAEHISMGRALASLREQGVLVIGSGSSFHNMRALMTGGDTGTRESVEFQDWLVDTCVNPNIDASERENRLVNWEQAPHARYCHPREEHLLPLQVCFGVAAEKPAEVIFDGSLLGLKMSGFLWT